MISSDEALTSNDHIRIPSGIKKVQCLKLERGIFLKHCNYKHIPTFLKRDFFGYVVNSSKCYHPENDMIQPLQ